MLTILISFWFSAGKNKTGEVTTKHFIKIAVAFSNTRKEKKKGWKDGKKQQNTVSQKYWKKKTGRKDNCHMTTSHCQENKNYNYFSGVLFQVFMELYRTTKSLHEKITDLPWGIYRIVQVSRFIFSFNYYNEAFTAKMLQTV